MIIPQVGMPGVLFCIEPKDGDTPAILRPAQIVSVSSYNDKEASVNLQILTDGQNDRRLFGEEAFHGLAWRASIAYDQRRQSAKTFSYINERMDSPRCESLRVMAPISHGRETIRKGALGTWDQLKNIIAFNPSFVDGMGMEMKAEYPADSFIDWHVARLEMPEGYVVSIVMPDMKSGAERPGERSEYLRDMVRDWESSPWGLPYPHSLSRRWARGEARQQFLEDEQRRELGDQKGERTRPRQPLLTQQQNGNDADSESEGANSQLQKVGAGT